MARQAEAGYVEIAFAMIVEAMTPGLAATSMSIEVVWGTNIAARDVLKPGCFRCLGDVYKQTELLCVVRHRNPHQPT